MISIRNTTNKKRQRTILEIRSPRLALTPCPANVVHFPLRRTLAALDGEGVLDDAEGLEAGSEDVVWWREGSTVSQQTFRKEEKDEEDETKTR